MADNTAPAIGISFSVSPSDGRNLVFQTHVARDVEVSVINDIIDKMYEVTDRLVNRAAAESLRLVLEKLEDDFEDQTRNYLASVQSVSGMEATLQSLMPHERDRDTREAKESRTDLGAKINAAREQHKTYLTNKEGHEHMIKRLEAKRAIHLELAQ